MMSLCVFRTVVLAMGMLTFPSQCMRERNDRMQSGTDAAAPAPAEEVIKGLTTAQEHASKIQDLAMKTQENINKKMQDAVAAGQMVDVAVVMELNGAIGKSLEAKQLHDKVSQHVGESKEFFELVKAFKANNEQMELVKKELEEEHEARTAHSEEEMKAAMEKWQTTIDALVAEQNAQKNNGLADLLTRWDGLNASLGQITATSTGLGVTVHDDVATGKTAAENWANEAMAFVCEQKKAEDSKMFTAGSACLDAVKAGSLLQEASSTRAENRRGGAQSLLLNSRREKAVEKKASTEGCCCICSNGYGKEWTFTSTRCICSSYSNWKEGHDYYECSQGSGCR